MESWKIPCLFFLVFFLSLFFSIVILVSCNCHYFGLHAYNIKYLITSNPLPALYIRRIFWSLLTGHKYKNVFWYIVQCDTLILQPSDIYIWRCCTIRLPSLSLSINYLNIIGCFSTLFTPKIGQEVAQC